MRNVIKQEMSKLPSTVQMDELEDKTSKSKQPMDDNGLLGSLPTKIIPRLSGKVKARKVDKFCVFAFPMAFGIFNFIYWPYYAQFYTKPVES